MTTTCKNCTTEYEGHFCPHCGQPAATHKLNFKFLWHDIQHTFLHLEKGILYTIKELFINPGKTIRGYIDGKRVGHIKPISLVFILGTIYGLLYHFSHVNIANQLTITSKSPKVDVNAINDWLGNHYALTEVISLPFLSLASYIVFRKRGYNYFEYLVMNCFLIGQRIVISLVLFPLLYISNGKNMVTAVGTVSGILGAWVIFRGYVSFFNTRKIWNTILMVCLLYILYYIVLGGIAVIIFELANRYYFHL